LHEPRELSQWLCYDDSTINIVVVIIIIIIIIIIINVAIAQWLQWLTGDIMGDLINTINTN